MVPMIDPLARAELIAEAAADPAVAVILLDLVLGYASHADPAGALVPALGAALERRDGLAVVAHVCGTEADPQVASRQEAALEAIGVRLAPTNASAALTSPGDAFLDYLDWWAGGLVLLGYAVAFGALGLLLSVRRDVS